MSLRWNGLKIIAYNSGNLCRQSPNKSERSEPLIRGVADRGRIEKPIANNEIKKLNAHPEWFTAIKGSMKPPDKPLCRFD